MKSTSSIVYLIFLLFSITRVSTAEEPDTSKFHKVVLSKLLRNFQSGNPIYSDKFIAELLVNGKDSQEKVKARLTQLISRLHMEQQKRSDLWKLIISKSSPQFQSDRAEKLMKYWIQESQNILKSNKNFLIEKSMRQAARKSKIPFFQSKSYLLRVLDWAINEGQNINSEKPLGIIVSGKSNRYEINIDPLLLFFKSQDEAFAREQIRELHRFIIPSLVRRLPESERILWCVRERESNALVKPNYQITFRVENFSFTGSNLDVRPCIELEIEVIDWTTRTLVTRQQLSHCSSKVGSSNSTSLSPFWDEIADQIRDLVTIQFTKE